MTIIDHAIGEFKVAGWLDENGIYCDDMQGLMCKQILELLQMFSSHGHSGSSAPYAINLFSKLAKYEILTLLTGNDDEWNRLDYDCEPKYQNKRCSHVFKNSDGRVYDIEGKIFYTVDDKGERSYFSSRDSHIDITFPYMPTIEYVEVKE